MVGTCGIRKLASKLEGDCLQNCQYDLHEESESFLLSCFSHVCLSIKVMMGHLTVGIASGREPRGAWQ